MKLILKLLFAPVMLVLSLAVGICSFALRLSAGVLGLIGTVLGILGLAVLILDNVKNGIIILVIAFLVSPLGLPMVAAWMVGLVQTVRYSLRDVIYR